MKKPILLILLFLLLIQPSQAQLDSPLFTRPRVPPHSVLERLNLKLAWAVRMPTDGLKDRLAAFQFLPSEKGDEILVQTRSGRVQLMDAETGDLKWHTAFGIPYHPVFPAAFNDEGIFIIRRDILYGLNRKTGKHGIFHIDKDSGLPILGHELLYEPSGPPIADVAALFVQSDDRLASYLLPFFGNDQINLPSINPELGLPAKLDKLPSPPRLLNSLKMVGVHTTHPLALFENRLGVIGDEGTFVSLDTITLQIRQTFKTGGPISVGMNQYDDIVYIASDDFIVYALDMHTASIEWRYLAGGSITQTPQPTEKDVFVTTRNRGLSRLHRANGRLVWNNLEADRFLAVNQKFVYATDKRGNLLVLDYLRGRTLARYDTRDYVIAFSNRWTDRIYLAAHDGTIICLHLDENRTPVRAAPFPKKEEEPENDEKG